MSTPLEEWTALRSERHRGIGDEALLVETWDVQTVLRDERMDVP
jgi:hypothetical protein